MSKNSQKKDTVNSGEPGQVKTGFCSSDLICILICSVLHILILKEKNTILFQAKQNWKVMYILIPVCCCFLWLFFPPLQNK